jgi:hypothetical protein
MAERADAVFAFGFIDRKPAATFVFDNSDAAINEFGDEEGVEVAFFGLQPEGGVGFFLDCKSNASLEVR